MKFLHATVILIVILMGIRYIPAAFAQDAAEEDAVTIQCKYIPLATNPEARKILENGLEDRKICPAGQYPARYGSGKHPFEGQECVFIKKGIRDFRNGRRPPIR